MPDLRPVLIYCRESRDENGAHYERIETQRDVLLEFCRRQGLSNVVDIVMDDHCTGTSFKRMEGILRRVKRGEIRVLVFKDSSRLGRNLKECLAFVELVEEYGGEILFESEAYNEDYFPLQAWFNERRAKEDSFKIRRILRHKMESSTLLVKPHYGYRRGPEGHTMVPDEQTAPIVREIFTAALQGKTPSEIARRLNGEGVPTPSQAASCRKASPLWNAQHIRRILQNNVYLGVMTHHRTSRKSYKNKTTVSHPASEWIVLENHHPPLITREEFDHLARRASPRIATGKNPHPFSGLLFCGRCGSALVAEGKKDRPVAYVCGKNHREGAVKDHIRPHYGCTPHRLREDSLCKAAWAYLAALLENFPPDLQAIRCRMGGGDMDRLRRLEEQRTQLHFRLDSLWEAHCLGTVNEGSFLRLREKYEAEEERLTECIGSLKERLTQAGGRLTEVDLGGIIKDLKEGTLTREVLGTVFERILVFGPGESCPGLSPAERQTVQNRGGVVFFTKTALPEGALSPQRITAGWL